MLYVQLSIDFSNEVSVEESYFGRNRFKPISIKLGHDKIFYSRSVLNYLKYRFNLYILEKLNFKID